MLKEYRVRKKMSQEELEKLTDVDRKTIFRIEKGINIPGLETFTKIVLALGLNNRSEKCVEK